MMNMKGKQNLLTTRKGTESCFCPRCNLPFLGAAILAWRRGRRTVHVIFNSCLLCWTFASSASLGGAAAVGSFDGRRYTDLQMKYYKGWSLQYLTSQCHLSLCKVVCIKCQSALLKTHESVVPFHVTSLLSPLTNSSSTPLSPFLSSYPIRYHLLHGEVIIRLEQDGSVFLLAPVLTIPRPQP